MVCNNFSWSRLIRPSYRRRPLRRPVCELRRLLPRSPNVHRDGDELFRQHEHAGDDYARGANRRSRSTSATEAGVRHHEIRSRNIKGEYEVGYQSAHISRASRVRKLQRNGARCAKTFSQHRRTLILLLHPALARLREWNCIPIDWESLRRS